MKDLKELPPKFVDTFIRHTMMIEKIGINIFDEKKHSFFIRHLKLAFFMILVMVLLVGQILYVLKRNEIGAQFLDVVSTIPSTFIVIQDLVKILVVTYKRDRIRKVIMEIGKIWPRELDDEEKKKTLYSWTKSLKFFDNAFFRAAIISLVFYELLPLAMTVYYMNTEVDAQYQFPVQMYFFCDLQSHFQYAMAYTYELVVCKCHICCMVHMCVYVSCDFLLVDLIFDLSALLSLLRIDLENLVEHNSNNYDFEDDDCEDIKVIVVKHQKLLSLAETLNEIFGGIIFSQVSFSSVIICCYSFMAVIADGMFLKNLTASLGIMFAIFIIAWPGQMLSDASNNVATAAYQCLWYERGKKFRKCIAIIIARSQKECHLSALGFSDLTLAMFSKVMSTSWSYLSLLNQMYDNIDE
ncbi:putative odorant receptor 85d [Vanessa cardui]|uniref:putative odorant receptor 85d n=1 Tax=Vanessa cardui TaxID=171605 RepID=UPI001F12B9C7|nr:putative odorant receptor 85d [Vanessa cardui]